MASDPGRAGLLRRATVVSILPANLAGAVAVYLYFAYVDPLGGGRAPRSTEALVLFAGVTGTLLIVNWYLGTRWTSPIRRWQARLSAGADASLVPVDIRRRVLNAALANAMLSLAGWTLAGLFYLVNLLFVFRTEPFEALRIFMVIVLVGGPVTSALAFLVSEFHWRREIPRFFPDGRLEREGVLRLPIRMRLAATFLLTSVLPLLLTLMVDLVIEWRDIAAREQMWSALLRAQLFIVCITGVASTIMAFLVARFINHPVQALRSAMASVADGNLDVRVPVRSTDELGELNQHFNAMVQSLRQAARARELFGRYVSPAVARQALERGVNLGGELVHATAMFIDLRGFTALTQELPPTAVVEVLNAYYAVVEGVCDREGGVITQFLGDGVVVVFGGPLQPLDDHAHRAVVAAVGVLRGLRARKSGLALEAGIGICTGDLIAGNIRARQRVVYTIVGDPVNQAARLQVQTRELGASILITESTRLGLGELGDVRLRPCGAVQLRGIGTSVLVHAVEA